LGQANISPDRKKAVIASEPSSLFADTIGLTLLDNNSKLYALYSDRTVFIWDISRLESITVFRAFLHHSSSINQIQILPTSTQELTLFVTASSDKTIRFWHLCQSDPKKLEVNLIRNVYSRELSRIIYITKSLDHFKQRIPEGEGCIKCISVSGDGKHIASGDSEGNLRVHRTDTLEEIIHMTAHDSDVVTLDYNTHIPREGDCEKGRALLASGSRDRLIHIFDVEADYKPVLTIDDHNSSIADLTFVRSEGQDRLISCAADRSIVFRTVNAGNASRYFQTIEKTKKCYSITPHPIHRIVLIGEDKSVKLSVIENGKVSREIEDYQEKGAKIINDSNYKIALDPSGLLCAVANLDRNVRLIEYYNGKVLSKMNVGEMISSMAFTPNAKKLLMTTNDGCIFIWRLSVDLTNAIRARLAQAPVSRPLEIEDLPERPKAVQEDLKQELLKIHEEPAIRCHDSVLPSWAKAEPSSKKSPFDMAGDSAIPGKWGRGPVKIEFDENLDDQPKPSEDFDFEEVDKKEFAPLCLPDQNKGRDSFKVTKSISGPCFIEEKEEEIKEDPPAEDVEEDEELNKLPELEPESTFVKNPMRQSLSSSFWKKKQEDVPKVGLFQFEQVQAEPWIVPSKPMVFRKKQVEEAQEDIKGALNKLQEIGIHAKPVKVFSDPEILVSEVKNPVSDIEEDYHTEGFEEEIPEELQTETLEEIAEEVKIIESPDHKSKMAKDLKRFDSPCNKETLTASKSFVRFSLSESQFSTSSKLTKEQYVRGFCDLKKSLQDVDNYFTSIDMTDPEYSVSFEESYKERKDILDLLVKISGQLGEPLGFNRENEIIERFSKKLVSKVEKQMRKREKKRDRDRERE
jgi:WD40 repeat protein